MGNAFDLPAQNPRVPVFLLLGHWAFLAPANGANICVGAELQHWCEAALQRPPCSMAHSEPVVRLLRDKTNWGITTLTTPHTIAHSEATQLRHTCRRCEPLTGSEPGNSVRNKSSFQPCEACKETQDSHALPWLLSPTSSRQLFPAKRDGWAGWRGGKQTSAAWQRPADIQHHVAHRKGKVRKQVRSCNSCHCGVPRGGKQRPDF